MESDPVVVLDVGGEIFRTRRSTLCNQDGYFQRMFDQDHEWKESTSSGPIFVDRDPACFAAVLSYLRSGVLSFDPRKESGVYLDQLRVECDFYGLDGLSKMILKEISDREEETVLSTPSTTFIQKAVAAPEVGRYLEQGWKYVGSYQGNETTSCAPHGVKIDAFWRNGACSACGTAMTYERFALHTSFQRPTIVVLTKDARLVPALTAAEATSSGMTLFQRSGRDRGDSLPSALGTIAEAGNLAFDESFG